MNLDEYKEWLKENAYLEEKNAVGVIEEIFRYHGDWDFRDAEMEIFPRHILTKDNERIEFDAVVRISWEREFSWGTRKYERLIGIEFKEYGKNKVISQCVRRRDFVDYMYMATRNIALDYDDVLIMNYFGIGWVVWDDDFAKIVFPARYRDAETYDSFRFMIRQSLKDLLRESLDRDLLKKTIEEVVREKVGNSKITEWY